jgi:mRNA-degrading endonuclease RelE of RelBE toxin-antitoxin system
MKFDEQPEFQKDLKRLAKKYKSLPNDLDEFKNIVSIVPCGNSKHFNVITKKEECVIIKARLFCRYLKGSSLRIIYAYDIKNKMIEFIELYPKNESENENRERIRKYLT